jgi:hypothetical protein
LRIKPQGHAATCFHCGHHFVTCQRYPSPLPKCKCGHRAVWDASLRCAVVCCPHNDGKGLKKPSCSELRKVAEVA